jgi:hypothetical protein
MTNVKLRHAEFDNDLITGPGSEIFYFRVIEGGLQ